jgi:hypothetical protein
MSRKRTRRKHYALVNPIAMAIDGACLIDDERLNKLRLLELSAVQAFATGAASITDWSTLSGVANLAQVMCTMGIGPEVQRPALEAQMALNEAYERFFATGRMGTTGPGLTAMRNLLEWHDLQRSGVARSVYEAAAVRCMNWVRSAHPSVKVCNYESQPLNGNSDRPNAPNN